LARPRSHHCYHEQRIDLPSYAKLTFHGGVEEIGGNKILLEDKDTKILLDFGMNFAERSKFYSEAWLSPRDERGLLEFDLLPLGWGLRVTES